MEALQRESEKSAWAALAACEIQQTSALSDEFLINAFAELIRRADPKQAWNHTELDERSNKQRIVRALRSLHLERYLSAPQHINPQLRQKVLSSLEALAVLARKTSMESPMKDTTPQATPARIFKPTHSLARTPRKDLSPRGAEKENHAEIVEIVQPAPATAKTPARTAAPLVSRPATPAPARPLTAQTPAPVAAPVPSTPAPQRLAEEAAAFARSRKIARTPVRRTTHQVAIPRASPTKELTAQLANMSIAPPTAQTPGLRRSPRRNNTRPFSPPRPPPVAATPKLQSENPITSEIAVTSAITPSLRTSNLSRVNTQQLAAIYIEKERKYVARELDAIAVALEEARQREAQLEAQEQAVDEQLKAMKERQLALLALLQEEGIVSNISAPNTPAALTGDAHLHILKEKQHALEEQLEAQQRMLAGAESGDKSNIMTLITENLAQYTAVVTQITEHINARRTQALTTQALGIGRPTPAEGTAPLAAAPLSVRKAPSAQLLPVSYESAAERATDEDDSDIGEEEPVPGVLSIKRVNVPQRSFASASQDAKQKLGVERERLLAESEQILRQMAARRYRDL